MKKKQLDELMITLSSMEILASEVIDGVASIRAELEQSFDNIEQTYHNMEGSVSA